MNTRHMIKWYEQPYVNHRDWLLENIELLNLSDTEKVLVLIIDYLNEKHVDITMDLLQKKVGLKKEELERVIATLCAKNYLEILASSKDVRFSLNGLYETDIAKDQRLLDTPLFDVFESEFGRPLSQKEMQKISEWNRTFDRKIILYALREASAYQKINFSYIESILNNWKEKGIPKQK